jgi:hypothetical protein
MASTISLTGDWLVSFGNKYQTAGTGNLGTYATNGVAVTAAQVGLGTIESLVIDPAGGYVFEWDKAAGKVKAYRSAAHTHVLHFQTSAAANAVTAAANSLRTAAAAFDVAGVADSTGEGGVVTAAQGVLAEVTTSTDLSSVTFRFRAVGY